MPAALGPDDREVLRRDVRETAQVRVHAPEDARKPLLFDEDCIGSQRTNEIQKAYPRQKLVRKWCSEQTTSHSGKSRREDVPEPAGNASSLVLLQAGGLGRAVRDLHRADAVAARVRQLAGNLRQNLGCDATRR